MHLRTLLVLLAFLLPACNADPKHANAAAPDAVVNVSLCDAYSVDLTASPGVRFAFDRFPPGHAPRVTLELDPVLGEQAFRIGESDNITTVTGGDDAGLMYGLLELAEAEHLDRDPKTEGTPFVKRRGLKMNIPLDGRAPSYDDSGTSAISNIPVVWERDFWERHLDLMAERRYNVLTLWHNQPFTVLVDLEDAYPGVNIQDVAVPTYEQNDKDLIQYRIAERTATPEAEADNFRVVKKMTTQEKIDHFRWLMAYAKERHIDVYFITWNIWAHGAVGKHGITEDQTNPATTAFYREAVKRFVLTYPDLKGMGVTLGEHFVRENPDKHPGADDPAYAPETWAWKTYGEGIRDAIADERFYQNDPDRQLHFIHRVWYGGLERMFEEFTRKYPHPIQLGFKYARARLYSTPAPPFFNNQLKDAAAEEGLFTWMNLRNDDLFTLRWGDPEYVRQYIKNLPPEPHLAGFHMGSDGYVWARESTSLTPEEPRQLEADKHDYRFTLWGRLAYDPELPLTFWVDWLKAHYGNDETPHLLLDAWWTASEIVPLINRFHWRDWDHMWSVETCMSKKDGYHGLDAFVEFGPLPGQGLQSINDFVRNGVAGDRQTPEQVADQLDALAGGAYDQSRRIKDTDDGPDPRHARSGEVKADVRAFAHLGHYYADKIRAATALHTFRVHGDPAQQQQAIHHAEAALAHWDAYAQNLAARHAPHLLARVSHADWTGRLRDFAAQDIETAKQAEPNVFPPSQVHSTLH